MLLHIGCGNVRIEDFVNIDCRATEATDIVSDAWNLRKIETASAEYIYARHMLEHLTRADAARSITEWVRILAPGGILHIVVPDIAFHARQLLGLAECPAADDQEAHAMAGLYGWQNPDNGGTGEDVHCWGYTRNTIERMLRDAGLTLTDDGFEQLVERDREPWHVNIRAMKGNGHEPSQIA